MSDPTPTRHRIAAGLVAALIALGAGAGAVVVAVLLLHTVIG
jgi:hypothetical protein